MVNWSYQFKRVNDTVQNFCLCGQPFCFNGDQIVGFLLRDEGLVVGAWHENRAMLACGALCRGCEKL